MFRLSQTVQRNDRLHGMPNVLGVMCEMNERMSFKNCINILSGFVNFGFMLRG